MKLSKAQKVAIGLATAWYAFYPLLFFAIWLGLVVGMFSWGSTDSGEFPAFVGLFLAVFPLHCLTILLGFVLMPFYLIHIIKNPTASETVRIIFGVGVFMFGFIAMPLYYYLFIWRDQPPSWALPPQPTPSSLPSPAGDQS